MANVTETTELGPVLSELEARVHKLEEAVTRLQESETLVVERITRRQETVIDSEPSVPMQLAIPGYTLPAATRQAWVLFEVLTDVWNMVLMFFDMRFHVGWATRVLAILLLPIVLTGFPFSWVPVIGWLIAPVANLLLSFVLFKYLCRDAQRYREYRARR